MQAVREYGRAYERAPSATEKPIPAQLPSASSQASDTDGPYQAHVADIVARGDFAQLENEAQQARKSKARLRGGDWKLFGFYDGVTNPLTGKHASNSDWQTLLASIKKWVTAYPDSATARVALAGTYINYAWAARGTGYSDTVSESSWILFRQLVELGKSTLLDAARLNEKCPYWYDVMQVVALSQGWEEQQARELLNAATAFEPTYYRFYRNYALFSLPKWYGGEGATQAFAEEVYTRLGGRDGSIVYFEIASLLACQLDRKRDSLVGMSWPRVKQGYANLDRLYSMSNLKMNRFGYMSFLVGDKSVAREVFAELGTSWNGLVWHSASEFESARAWALTP